MAHKTAPPSAAHSKTSTAAWIALLVVSGLIAFGGVIWWMRSTSPSIDLPPAVDDKKSSIETEATIQKPLPPDDSYIGSQTCAGCHPQIAESCQRTAMGRSLANVGDAPAPHEDYDRHTSFDKGVWNYRVERKDDRVWHHEMLSDDEGVIYDQAEEIQYAMGSNTRGRSYLLWREGSIFNSPIAWYAQEGWDLAPGYPPGNHPRFSRRAVHSCLACHSGRLVTERNRENYYPEPVFHEMAIGCERCHGPGRAHVAYREQANPDGQDPLLDLRQLASAERDAVCYQCHFQGEERILRYGRSDEDFRPGMKVNDVWTIFLKGKGIGANGGKTAIVSQAMQMQSSRCFQASNGRMGCVTCHDPHRVPEHDGKNEFFDRRCLTCHADLGCSLPTADRQASPANGSCVLCHMPALRAKSIPHTSQSDHRILRHSSSNQPVSLDTSITTYEEDGATVPAVERARARGLMLSHRVQNRKNRRQADEAIDLLQQALRAMPDDSEIQFSLGAAISSLGREREAQALWNKMLGQFPHHEGALLRLANASHDAGRYEEADHLFARLVELTPSEAATHGRWAHSLGKLDRLEEGIVEAHRALALDPSLLPMYGWLAEAYAIRGDQERSKHFKQLGERLLKRLSNANSR